MRKRIGYTGLVGALLSFGIGTAVAQDLPEEPIILLQGITKLVPPAEAENQDASGLAHLRQIAERIAIHVHVQNLEPGATYGVVLQIPADVDPATVDLGTITTHDGVAPPPRCFSGQLTEPVEEPPVEEPVGDGVGGGGHLRGDWPLPGHGDWQEWRDRFHHDRPMTPRGSAYLVLNEDGTELRYTISTRGVGEVTSASLMIGEGDPIDVSELRGSVAVTAEQVEALVAGQGVVEVVGADATIVGPLGTCIPQEWRDSMAARKAGRGSLRLDTNRGDVLPVEMIAGLEGATIEVQAGDGTVVLAGTVDEIVDLEIRCGHWRPHTGPGDEPEDPTDPNEPPPDDGTDPAGGEGGAVIEELFSVGEVHDARFLRGDSNDDQILDLSDALTVLLYLFQGNEAPYCLDAADADDNGAVEISDPILVLGALFLGDGRIASPYPYAGFDETPDTLFCAQ